MNDEALTHAEVIGGPFSGRRWPKGRPEANRYRKIVSARGREAVDSSWCVYEWKGDHWQYVKEVERLPQVSWGNVLGGVCDGMTVEPRMLATGLETRRLLTWSGISAWYEWTPENGGLWHLLPPEKCGGK